MMMMTMILMMRACGAFVCFLNGSLVLGQIRCECSSSKFVRLG